MRNLIPFLTGGVLTLGSYSLMWFSGPQSSVHRGPEASAVPATQPSGPNEQGDPKPKPEPGAVEEAQNHFYMVMFASQRDPVDMRNAHTFAAFVQATGKSKNVEGFQTEVHTLSWMPRSLNIVVLRARPEPGLNLDLAATLDWAASVQAPVTAWGPYRIDEKLYRSARGQIDRLNSGGLAYKAVNLTNRSDATNCIYALADIEQEQGLLATGKARGVAASLMVLRHFQHRIIEPNQTHEWVIDRLGLGNHAVTFATLP